MLNVISLQKQERDSFLSGSYLERDGLVEAKEALTNNLIKVITGPRRAGKSIFGFMLLKEHNFAYLNFEDDDLLKVDSYDELLPWLKIVYPDFKYLFLDEIQNLPNWERWVNKLHRRGYNIVITGSNAKLLSGELASSLTGRYHLIEVFPLSLNEVRKIKENYEVLDYLLRGGYPEVVVNNLNPNSYLKTLFDAVLFKDVVKRYEIRQPKKIYDLGKYLSSNFSTNYSYRNIKKLLNLKSVTSTQKYINLLEETYMFFSLNKFDNSVRNQISQSKKTYIIDTGFSFSSGFQNSSNLGRLLENVVFIDLLRRGLVLNKDLFYYKTKSGREVDFVLREGLKVSVLIQVCLNVISDKTLKREKTALIEASKELSCKKLIIVTLNQTGFEDGIEIVKAEDYLGKDNPASK